MTDVLQSSIAAEVRAEMARQQISQARLAEYLGLHPTAVSKKLQGHRAFAIDELVKTAELLGVPLSKFVPDRAAAA